MGKRRGDEARWWIIFAVVKCSGAFALLGFWSSESFHDSRFSKLNTWDTCISPYCVCLHTCRELSSERESLRAFLNIPSWDHGRHERRSSRSHFSFSDIKHVTFFAASPLKLCCERQCIESLFYFNSRCVEVEPRQPKAWPRAGFSHDCAIRANTLGPVVTIWFTIWDFGKNALEAGNFLPRSNCLKTYANEEKNICEWGNPCIGSDWVTPHSHRCEWKLCSSVAQINMLVNALSSVHGHRTIIFASHNAASRP